MLSLFSAQLLKSYGHFSKLGVKICLSHCHVKKTLIFSGKTNTAIHDLDDDFTATAQPVNRRRSTNDVLVLARCLRGRRIIRQALGQRLVFAGNTAVPQFQINFKMNDYFQGIGSVLLFIQRIGSVSAILASWLCFIGPVGWVYLKFWLYRWYHGHNRIVFSKDICCYTTFKKRVVYFSQMPQPGPFPGIFEGKVPGNYLFFLAANWCNMVDSGGCSWG